MAALISARDLTKSYGAGPVVDCLSLAVERGEVLGLLGPNGAGKSTTMKMLTGYLTPDSGRAHIGGFDVFSEAIEAKRLFGYLPEGAPAYGDMTPASFLKFTAQARGLSGAKASDAIAKAVSAVQIEAVMGQKIETLSKGFGRRVGLAQAILHDPQVLILDEPTDGLDPNQKHEVRQLILGMAERKAIIISTHILEEVEAVCSRAIIVDHGVIVADGTPQALKTQSPLHGRVVLRVQDSEAGSLKPALTQMPQVKAMDTRACPVAVGTTEVILDGGSTLLKEVKLLLDEGNWKVEDIRVPDGRLEDVFRALTTGDRMAGDDMSNESERAA